MEVGPFLPTAQEDGHVLSKALWSQVEPGIDRKLFRV